MLSLENLKKFISKFQTSERNVLREYVQHIFLSFLYTQSRAEDLLFKGGTALRIIYGSPRFSEDLDFTGVRRISYPEIEELFANTLAEIERLGIAISIKEAKPTTGGYLGILAFQLYNLADAMKFEISLRNGKVHSEVATITNEYIPAYSIVQFKTEALIKEKINFKKDLAEFLPVSHHMILRDFKTVLHREIMAYL